MADRFERYRRRPLQIPDVPSVDFVSAGRAQQQAAYSIAGALDKVADFAFEYQKEKKIEYGVANAPTMEQIEKARETGEAVDFPSGRIAEAAAVNVVRSRMQRAVNLAVVELDADPKTRDLSFEAYAEKLDSIIGGYASVLEDNVGMTEGEVFRADMSKTYNQHLVAWSKLRIAEAEEDAKIAARSSALADMDTFDNVVRGGAVVGADGTVTTPIDVIDDKINRIRQLDPLNATEVKQLVDAAENKKIEAVKSYVGEWVRSAPDKNIGQLLSGNIDDPSIATLLNDLDSVERRDVVLRASQEIEENETIERNRSAAIERKIKERTDSISELATNAYLNNDREELDAQLSLLADVNLEAYNKLNETFRKEGGVDNPDVVQSLTILSANNRITADDVNGARNDLSIGTYKEFMSKVVARRKEDHNVAMDVARATLGIPKNSLMVDKEKGARLAKAENELNLAARIDPTIDRVKWMQDYAEKYMNNEALKKQEQARREIDAAKKLAGVETDEEFRNYVQGKINNKQYYSRQMKNLRLLGLVGD